MLGKPHPIGRKSVYIGSFNQFLTVTAKVTIAKVVGQDINNVWFISFRWRWNSSVNQS
jgi:hypothetical protein